MRPCQQKSSEMFSAMAVASPCAPVAWLAGGSIPNQVKHATQMRREICDSHIVLRAHVAGADRVETMNHTLAKEVQ